MLKIYKWSLMTMSEDFHRDKLDKRPRGVWLARLIWRARHWVPRSWVE